MSDAAVPPSPPAPAGPPREVPLGPSSFLPKRGFVVVPVLPAFALPDGTKARSALLGHAGGRFVAYANVCRHLAIPLDYGDGEVMDDDDFHLLCHHHGATFEPATGECILGPCHGEFLWEWHVRVDDFGDAVLVLAPPG